MDQKVRGLLSYLFGWLGGLIILLGFKDNTKQTNFHACQAIVLCVAYIAVTIAINIISFIFGFAFAFMSNSTIIITILSLVFGLIGWALNIGYIVLAILGMVKAYHEEDYELPVISNLTRKIFKSKLA